jgi:hypothetical protein
MQKYISLFFSVLLFLSACSSDGPPKGILEEKAMIGLLTDIHLTDGTIYTVPQLPDSMYKYAHAKFAEVFKRHHTTDAVFKQSLKYYSKHPELIQDMYAQIEASVKAKIDSVNKPQANPGNHTASPASLTNRPAVAATGSPSAQTPNQAVPARPNIPGPLHRPKSKI